MVDNVFFDNKKNINNYYHSVNVQYRFAYLARTSL